MTSLSTNQVAKKLGVATKTLSRYIAQGKIPSPRIMKVGEGTVHIWTEAEAEALRKLLPKIKNGRKTRYQKKRQSAISTQQSAKPKTKKERRKKK